MVKIQWDVESKIKKIQPNIAQLDLPRKIKRMKSNGLFKWKLQTPLKLKLWEQAHPCDKDKL